MDSDKKDFYNTVKLVIGAAIVIFIIGLIVRAYLKAQNQKNPKDERRTPTGWRSRLLHAATPNARPESRAKAQTCFRSG